VIRLTDPQIDALDRLPPGWSAATMLSLLFPGLSGRFILLGVGSDLYLKQLP